MFSVFPFYGLANKITLNFDSEFHNSNLMMCLTIIITQTDTQGETLLNKTSF